MLGFRHRESMGIRYWFYRWRYRLKQRNGPVFYHAVNPYRNIRIYRKVAGLAIVEWKGLARWPKGRTWHTDIPLVKSPDGVDVNELTLRDLRKIFGVSRLRGERT